MKEKLKELLVAVVLVLTVSLPIALAYFTTYTEAKGGLELRPWTIEIKEKVENWTKHVVISNSEDGAPSYVRVKAFAGNEVNLTYLPDEKWELGDDGYYYYQDILQPGEDTSELLVKFEKPEDPVDGQEFNVIVVYETTPVQYDAAGQPFADWSKAGERSAE